MGGDARAYIYSRYNDFVSSQSVQQIASADFPTRWGKFRIFGFRDTAGKEEAVALVMGDVRSVAPLVRIHSQCLTGDVCAPEAPRNAHRPSQGHGFLFTRSISKTEDARFARRVGKCTEANLLN